MPDKTVIIPMRAQWDIPNPFTRRNTTGEQKYPLGTEVYNKRAAGIPVKLWVSKWNPPGGDGPWNTYWLQDGVEGSAVCQPKDRNVKEEDVGLWEKEWNAVIEGNPDDWDAKAYLKIRLWSPTELADAARGLARRVSKNVRR